MWEIDIIISCFRVESPDANARSANTTAVRSATTAAVCSFVLFFAFTGCRSLWNLANRDRHNEARSGASSDTLEMKSMSTT